MKFSDGYWQVREGFDVQHPAQAYDVSADERGAHRARADQA